MDLDSITKVGEGTFGEAFKVLEHTHLMGMAVDIRTHTCQHHSAASAHCPLHVPAHISSSNMTKCA